MTKDNKSNPYGQHTLLRMALLYILQSYIAVQDLSRNDQAIKYQWKNSLSKATYLE